MLGLAVLVAALLLGPAVPPAVAQASHEGDFVGRINAERAGRGLGQLEVYGELVGVARRWSQKMADSNTLQHNPNLAREVTADWEKLAENVGVGGSVDDIHRAFMNSAGHRANILDPVLTHIGVGVVTGPDGRIWVTEVFMKLRGGGSAPQPAPTTTAAPAPPPTTAAPRPTTTRAPAPATTAAPRPSPTTTAAPPPPPDPEPAPVEEAAPPPPPPKEVPRRITVVLDVLHAIDTAR